MNAPAGARVVVVDDEAGIRDLLRYELSSRGWSIFCAPDGQAALAEIERTGARLLISDVRMPGLDGLSLLETVRARHPAVEVVLMTGYGSVETAVEAMRKGAYDFILKPFEIDALVRVAEKALERESLKAMLAIHEAARIVHAPADLDEILARVVEIGAKLLKADDACLLLREGGELRAAAYSGLDDPEARDARAALAGRGAGDARFVILGPLAEDERYRDLPALRGVRSALILPLAASGSAVGTFCACRTGDGAPFGPDDARQLEILASHATHAVLNDRLSRELAASRARLLESERRNALGRVASCVAHEINNPLTSILGATQMLQLSGLSAEQAEDASCIVEQVERCRRIVADLLAFGRGRRPTLTPEDLVAIVESSLRLVRWDLGAATQVVREYAAAPIVRADTMQVKQVLVNFLRNAAQATAGVPSPRLTLRVDAGPLEATVSVADNGCGFDDAARARLFKPFYTTKPPGEGTGLGLSVCAEIAASHGGRVEADGNPGSGATFRLVLPLASQEGA